ncbi:MAG: hypothetical protein JSR72_12980 [Proteobacteria bacterium]|nr:hypothetical protein [Pseudomonadota bacterium]
MLVVYWGTSIWLLSYGPYATWHEVQSASALTLFFGTLIAVPAGMYFLCADLLAHCTRFPWNVLAYVVLVGLGCVAYGAVILYLLGSPLPKIRDGFGYLPLLAMSLVPLIWRVAKTPQRRSEPSS